MHRTLIICLLFLIISIETVTMYAQEEGDQFLDGIGETALIARYQFNGTVEDGSRNSLHADFQGNQSNFVEDRQFGKVLSLPGGKKESFVQIPGRALIGAESLSVTGWVNVKDLTPEQCFFDLGLNTQRFLNCMPVGSEREDGCRVTITTQGQAGQRGPAGFRITPGQWFHLAAVLNASEKTLSLYINGIRVGQTTDVNVLLTDILDQDNPAANHLYIGKSQFEEKTNFGGLIYDVRFYNIALTDRQVATIHQNAISDEIMISPPKVDEPIQEKQDAVLQTTSELLGVPDVTVKTTVGYLPRLPYHIPSIHHDNVEGPLVRVVWPVPTDNSVVKEPGTYTFTGTVPGTDFEPKAVVTVTAAQNTETIPKLKLHPFELGQVILNPDQQGRTTPFIKNRDKFIQVLAKTNPDNFLYNFRDTFGQEQPEGTHPLGGWDSQTTRLRGHASGHYLSAIAQTYASTSYDTELQVIFAQKMDYMIDVLYKLSQMSGKPAKEGGPFNTDPAAVPHGEGRDGYDSDLSKERIRTDYWNWGKGFISGYPPDQFIMLEHGSSYGGRNNQIWAPYYTLHKILAGLLDCYEVGGNPKALEIAKGMGIWVYKRLKVVPTEIRIQMWNRYIAGEYGGMNEVMARLYRITGNRQFLECAQLFDNIDFFFGNVEHDHGLAKNVDTIRSKHANQHIPQIIGALETFKCNREIAYYHIADNFWDMCTHCYMYCIGGVAGARNPNNAECFTTQPNTLFSNGFSKGGQNETCATYNLLKLSRQLFMFDQDAKYMDYYEQALYNHILASVAGDNPGNTYHVPLNPGSRKKFGNAHMDGFTCCNGTAIESNTKLQDSIYFKSTDNNALYVNLYVPSTLNWKDKNVKLTQLTNFPYSDTSTLLMSGGGTFDLYVRIPRWIQQGSLVKVNGKKIDVKAVAGTYLNLGGSWKDGDTIELKMPMDFYLSPIMDQPNIAAVFYGPVLLATEESDRRSDWCPLILNADDISKSFTGDPATLRFSSNGLKFKPFYETYGRYSVYFDLTYQVPLELTK